MRGVGGAVAREQVWNLLLLSIPVVFDERWRSLSLERELVLGELKPGSAEFFHVITHGTSFFLV